MVHSAPLVSALWIRPPLRTRTPAARFFFNFCDTAFIFGDCRAVPPTFCQQIETVHHQRTVKSIIVISGICKSWQPDSGHPPTVTLPQSSSHSHPLTNNHIIGSLSALIVPRSPESRYFEPYCLPLLPLHPLLPKLGGGIRRAKG